MSSDPQHHRDLRRKIEDVVILEQNPAALRVLNVTEQQVLRRYYVTTQQLTDDQLIASRLELDVRKPSVGTRAGKAFAALQHETSLAHAARVHVPAGTEVKGPRQLSVSAVFRPEPDVVKLVQAFFGLAEQQRAKQDDEELELPLAA